MSDLSDSNVEEMSIGNENNNAEEISISNENSNAEEISINNETKKKLFPVNKVEKLNEKLNEIKLDLPWIEKLEVSLNIESLGVDENKSNLAENDIERENAFCIQAQKAACKAILRLKKLDVPTLRPSDYFAEMAKSDAHMAKVQERKLSKQMALERSEKVRFIREQKKHGKKIQQEIIQQKKAEKKKMINALKKTKKGKMSIETLLSERKEQTQRNKPQKGKKRREYHDMRYGYGGKKKGMKYNTAESFAEFGGGKQKGKNSKLFNSKKQCFTKPPKKKQRRRR